MTSKEELELRKLVYNTEIDYKLIFKWDDNLLSDEGLALVNKILKWHKKYKQ